MENLLFVNESYILEESFKDIISRVSKIISLSRNKELLMKYFAKKTEEAEKTRNRLNKAKNNLTRFLETFLKDDAKKVVTNIEKKIKEEAKKVAKRSSISKKNIIFDIIKANRSIIDYIKDIAAALSEKLGIKENESIFKAILFSLFLIALILYINTFMYTLFFSAGISLFSPVSLFGEKLIAHRFSLFITSVFVAPITEELGKLISIHANTTKTFYILFNVFETLNYIILMSKLGISVIEAAIIRIVPVLIHTINTLIHVTAKKYNKAELGFYLAAIIHGLYNFAVNFI